MDDVYGAVKDNSIQWHGRADIVVWRVTFQVERGALWRRKDVESELRDNFDPPIT